MCGPNCFTEGFLLEVVKMFPLKWQTTCFTDHPCVSVFWPPALPVCVFRLQPIREAHIQGGRAGSLQDPQRRHGEECVRGGLHQHPHLPQQGNIYVGRIPSQLISWIHFPASDRHFLPLQPMMLRDLRFGVEPDDGENLRRIGRSLSGTVMTPRRSRLTATRSFVSLTSRALLPPCGLLLNCICLMSRRGILHIAFPCALLPCCLSCFFLLSCCSISNLSFSLCFSSFPFLSLSQRWSRLMSVPLLAYFLSSESLLLFHHYHLLHPPHHQHLLITTSLHRFTGKHYVELIWRYTCNL